MNNTQKSVGDKWNVVKYIKKYNGQTRKKVKDITEVVFEDTMIDQVFF